MKRIFQYGVIFTFIILCAIPVSAGTIDPSLSDILLSAGPDDKIGTIVLMKVSFNVQEAWGNYISVVTGLKTTAEVSQADLLNTLSYYETMDQASDVKSFWIINAVAMKATASVIEEIAKRDDVETVTLDKMRTIPPPIIEPIEGGVQAIEWNISKVRAPEVWALGYNGTGVVVANIDTGVYANHPALISKYRGGTNSWFDAVNSQPNPYDDHGHGTHTMGTMVGDDGGVNQIGVAPGSKFIAAKGCNSGGSCADSWLLAAGQWAMDPDSNPATPDYPKVINNSWGGGGCDGWYRSMVTNWRAAGIFPSFSAGNNGPGSGTVGSPGDYPESFAVGATDINDLIASFSGRGPSCWAEIKPEVTAPGVNIRSSIPNGGYQGGWNGTSMAAPHVSGGVALLLQIDPALTINEIEDVLKTTAVDLGTAGPDNNYGWGRIDLYEAALAVGSAPTGPDLVVSQLTAPSIAYAGATIYVNNSVTNQGNETAASSKVGFYLSVNNTPSISPSDVFFGSRDVPKTSDGSPWPRPRSVQSSGVEATGLAPGETSTDNTSLTVPLSTSEGMYYVKAKADYNGQVAETNEANNILVSGQMEVKKSAKPPWPRR